MTPTALAYTLAVTATASAMTAYAIAAARNGRAHRRTTRRAYNHYRRNR